MSVLLGRPGGGFEPRVDFATGGSPSGLTIGTAAAGTADEENIDAAVAVLRAGAYELAHKKDVPGRVVVAEYGDVASAFVERDEIGQRTSEPGTQSFEAIPAP